jgi:membrane-bound lytic murein transglycosylase B
VAAEILPPMRVIGLLALALATVAGLGYLASQTILARPTFDPARPPHYLSAPAPGEVERTVAAGRPLGPPRVDPAWLATVSDRTGIPSPALNAYARVQLDGGAGCRVGWTTLAGIGWVESQHGTIGGRALRPTGRSSRPIVGPALDGHGQFAAIEATAGSQAFHGDPDWEHAVGPMQFLPESWRSWATDGDGDGTTDPDDLDDAAATAARYLCASGGDLTTGSGWEAAILSYNHAQDYVDAVRAAAIAYADRSG